MQNSKEVKNPDRRQFAWIYKAFCRDEGVKPLPFVQAYLQENCLRFSADRVDLKDWSPILNSIAENRSLSEISIYSRSRCRKIREKINTEEKVANLWQCRGQDQTWPILYTNFLLRCLVDSVAVFLRDSSTVVSITLDGIPLGPNYLKILCSGLELNRSLRSLSLNKCRIGDVGCDWLLSSLRDNTSISVLNFSSCCLTNRSAMSLSLFLKSRRANLLKNAWQESLLQTGTEHQQKEGLHTLVLNTNRKFGDNGTRQLTHVLKNDFWLKSLGLRHCGITIQGGKTIVELLQTNSILTKMDLDGNAIPKNMLYVVLRILKRRREKGERISLRKRLPNWKNISQNLTVKKKIGAAVWKRGKRLLNRKKRQRKNTQRIDKGTLTNTGHEVWKVKDENSARTLDLRELESRASDATNLNVDLNKQLTSNKMLLDAEKYERTRAETECERIMRRLNHLESKVIILSCIRSKARGESQLLKTLRCVFENLETLSAAVRPAAAEANPTEKAIVNLTRSHCALENTHMQTHKIARSLRRRPHCPPLKI